MDTIKARTSAAWDVGYGRNLRLSLRALLKLQLETESIISPFHPTTLNIRRGIAHWIGETGEKREAARMYLRLVNDCMEHLDENEWITYASMLGYAECVGASSAAEHAVELLNEFEAWMHTRRTPTNELVALRYERARQLSNAGQRERALKEFESLVADEERMNGRLNSRALQARRDWLECMASNGDHTRALRIAQDLLNECHKCIDSQHIDANYLRRSISTISAKSGDVTAAIRILNELKYEMAQRFGEDAPDIRVIDYRLRYVVALERARTGCLSEAADELRRLSEDIAISHGITWSLREKALHQLDVLRRAAVPAKHGDGSWHH